MRGNNETRIARGTLETGERKLLVEAERKWERELNKWTNGEKTKGDNWFCQIVQSVLNAIDKKVAEDVIYEK